MNERPESTDRALTALATTDFWTISTDPTWRRGDGVGFWVAATDERDQAELEKAPAGRRS